MEKMGEPALKKDRVYTYGDYLTWPDDERWELIEGTAWNISAAPNRIHQQYQMEFSRQIANFLKDHPCKVYPAPFDVLLPDADEDTDDITTVVQPDISVICDKTKLTPAGCTGAPDWIIEILSPHTMRKDLSVKLELYRRHGVREYWTADPGNRCVQIFILDTEGRYPEIPVVFIAEEAPRGAASSTVVPCAVIPGLSIDLDRVFAEN